MLSAFTPLLRSLTKTAVTAAATSLAAPTASRRVRAQQLPSTLLRGLSSSTGSFTRSNLTPFQTASVAFGSAITAFIDPARGDMVALLGELTGSRAAQSLLETMEEDDEGLRVLFHRPRIKWGEESLKGLEALPEGSFGRAYWEYLRRYGFSPNERHEVSYVGSIAASPLPPRQPSSLPSKSQPAAKPTEVQRTASSSSSSRDKDDEAGKLAYVLQRYREVHDFWHVLSGLPPSVLGEVAVKWLEMAQTGLPMCTLSAFVGPLRLSPEQRRLLLEVYIPWAARVGREASSGGGSDSTCSGTGSGSGALMADSGTGRRNKKGSLLCVYYEELFPLPLEEVRRRLKFPAAPPLPL